MVAIGFFILFFGILAAMGAPGRARHGDFDKVRKAFKHLVLATESIIMLVVSVAMLALLYVYAIIEVGANTILKKLKLSIRFLAHPVQCIKSRKKDNGGEDTKNKEEQQKVEQADEGFSAKVFVRYNDVIKIIGLQIETIIQEIDEERAKLNHADLKKEPEEKNTNELIEETEGTACAPRTRRRKKKRRSKKWRKKK